MAAQVRTQARGFGTQKVRLRADVVQWQGRPMTAGKVGRIGVYIT